MEYVINHSACILDTPVDYAMTSDKAMQGLDIDIHVFVDSASHFERCILRFSLDTHSTVRIGKFTSIGLDLILQLRSELHHPAWASQYAYQIMPWDSEVLPKPRLARSADRWDISIGSDVWIEEGVRIFSGVSIGDGAVIRAGSIVTKDVPPYAICGGNPAVVQGYRFAPEDIEFLRKTAWWDLPIDVIGRLAPYLCSSDIDELKRQISNVRGIDAPLAKAA